MGESVLTACGPPAASFTVHQDSRAVTPAWSVYKSRGDNVVRMSVHLKRCVLQRGKSGDGCELSSTLRKGDLFVVSWAKVRRV